MNPPYAILDFGFPILDWRSLTTGSFHDLKCNSNKTKWYYPAPFAAVGKGGFSNDWKFFAINLLILIKESS